MDGDPSVSTHDRPQIAHLFKIRASLASALPHSILYNMYGTGDTSPAPSSPTRYDRKVHSTIS